MHIKMGIHYLNRKLLRRLVSYKVCLYLICCVRVNTVQYGCYVFSWESILHGFRGFFIMHDIIFAVPGF